MKSKFIYLLSVVIVFANITANAQTFTNYNDANGLPHNNVLCLAEDGAGNMWFGTQEGVAVFDGTIWEYFNIDDYPEMPHNTITAIAIDGNNNVWIGTDFGAGFYDGVNWTTYTVADGLGSDRIKYITVASNGDIWFSEFNGATLFDGTDFTVFNMSNGLPFGGVEYIYEDTNNDIWMGTGLNGLMLYDGTTLTPYTESDGLISNLVRALAIDEQGNKWVGTAEGISVFDNNNQWFENHTRMLTIPEPDTLNPVEDLAIDLEGNIWAGVYIDYLVTEGGISMYDGTSWTGYDVSDGLIGPVIRRIAVDASDNIWVATSTGVSMITKGPNGNSSYMADNQDFNIYPNPALNSTNIAFSENADFASNLEIYNMNMQLIKTIDINNSRDKITISTSNLQEGVYFVKHGNYVDKLILN